jgi:hypothetical protein
MFRDDPSESERVTDLGIDAEVQRDRSDVAGSFDKISRTRCPFAISIGKVPTSTPKRSFPVVPSLHEA